GWCGTGRVALFCRLLAFAVCSLAGSSSGSSHPGAVPPQRSSAASRTATVRFVSLSPVELRGRNFRPGEHVRVVVHSGGDAARKRVNARGGHFTATLSIAADGCRGATAQATGDRGSRASAALVVRACPPAE